MKKQRRKHRSEFKTQVTLKAIRGAKTLSEIRDFDIHPVMVENAYSRRIRAMIPF